MFSTYAAGLCDFFLSDFSSCFSFSFSFNFSAYTSSFLAFFSSLVGIGAFSKYSFFSTRILIVLSSSEFYKGAGTLT